MDILWIYDYHMHIFLPCFLVCVRIWICAIAQKDDKHTRLCSSFCLLWCDVSLSFALFSPSLPHDFIMVWIVHSVIHTPHMAHIILEIHLFINGIPCECSATYSRRLHPHTHKHTYNKNKNESIFIHSFSCFVECHFIYLVLECHFPEFRIVVFWTKIERTVLKIEQRSAIENPLNNWFEFKMVCSWNYRLLAWTTSHNTDTTTAEGIWTVDTPNGLFACVCVCVGFDGRME